MSVRVFYDILNQKGTPAMYTDTLANRPAFGFQGRLFISTDSGQIFEDTGSAWTLVADAGVGGGTLSSVCLNGNTTATGIVITAGGLSSNSITNTGITAGSVVYAGTGGLMSQSNSTFFWDSTNNRLGIGNASPGAPLDIHGTGTQIQVNGTGANNSYIQFQNAGVNKWRIGNTYGGAANSFDIYNNNLAANAISINSANLITTSSIFCNTSLTSNGTFTANTNINITNGAGITVGAGYNVIASDSLGFFLVKSNSTNWAYLLLSNLTAARNFTFPDATGTLALTSDIPANPVSGTGTTNTLPKFTGTSAIGNSNISDNGSLVTIAGLSSFTGTTASDGGQLGSELAAVTGTGTNWTLAGTNLNVGGYTHTTGSTTALTTSLAAVNGNSYQIVYTITGRTAGTINISFGGQTSGTQSVSGTVYIKASSTSVLIITPTTDFDGNVIISLKQVTAGSATTTFQNSLGTANIEVRASGVSNTNTFIGLNSGRYNVTGGTQNTSLGSGALASILNATNNTAIGYNAGTLITGANNATLIGQGAGAALTIGNNNTLIGQGAGAALTTASNVTLIGQSAGLNITNASNTTLVGAGAGQNITSNSNNTAIGYQALTSLTSGNNNIAFGYQAARYYGGSTSNSLTVIDNSILIGYQAFAGGNSQTNQIVIGYQTTGLGSNTTVIGNSSTTATRLYGNLLLGTNTDAGTGVLQVTGAATFSSSVTASTNFISNIVTDTPSTGTSTAANATYNFQGSSGYWGIRTTTTGNNFALDTYNGGTPKNVLTITQAGNVGTTSRLNVNGTSDNSLFSLNTGGTLYTGGFSPNAQASSSNTLTLTSAGTVWIYNGTGVATWTLFNPSGTNQMVWIKNAGTGIITLNAYSGTNIINNSGSSVSSITIAVGATALIQQDGNVKSYQLQ